MAAQQSFDLEKGILLYNCKIKHYPDGKTNTIYCNRPIFHPDIEKDDIKSYDDTESDDSTKPSSKENSGSSEFREDVLKRNREKVFDIVYSNKWIWFLTITFDPKNVDSSNVSDVMRKLQYWLNHKVQRSGLKYILIPERFHHSDGIHCHALVNDAIKTEYSGRVRFGKKSFREQDCERLGIEYTDNDKIYNVPDWKYGFSTALPVTDNSGKLSVYLTKYITKGVDRIFGRYYWSSRNIVREPEIEYLSVPYDEIDLPEYTVPGTCYKCKYLTQMEYTLS